MKDLSRSALASSFIKALLVGALGGVTLLATEAAHAEEGKRAGRTHLAVDFDFGSVLDAPGSKSGGGGAVRLGRKYDLLLVSFTPELGGNYHTFADDASTRVYSGFLGGRFGVGKILEPSIYGHVGYGRVDGYQARSAPVLDAGLALDLTLLPLVDLGVHGGYNVLLHDEDNAALKFLTLGAQVALVF